MSYAQFENILNIGPKPSGDNHLKLLMSYAQFANILNIEAKYQVKHHSQTYGLMSFAQFQISWILN